MIRRDDLQARKCFCEEYLKVVEFMQCRYEAIKQSGDTDRRRAMERLLDMVLELQDKGSYDD